MTTRLSGIVLAGLLAAWGVAGCGGDDGEKTSGTRGDDDDRSDEGTDEGTACGTMTCEAPEGFQGQLCCKSHFEEECGQMVAGTCVDLPPEPHPTCESTSFMAGGGTVGIPSCCTDTNECGLVFGVGVGPATCTSLSRAHEFGARFRAMGMGGMTMMFDFTGNLPAPMTCDGEPIDLPEAGSGG